MCRFHISSGKSLLPGTVPILQESRKCLQKLQKCCPGANSLSLNCIRLHQTACRLAIFSPKKDDIIGLWKKKKNEISTLSYKQDRRRLIGAFKLSIKLGKSVLSHLQNRTAEGPLASASRENWALFEKSRLQSLAYIYWDLWGPLQ